jgi:uncharacterized protein (TIGR03118 family)
MGSRIKTGANKRGSSGMKRHTRNVIMGTAFGAGIALLSGRAEAFFQQTDLVSDIPGMAEFTDPDLVNPWGMSSSAMSPIWVSDNGTGLSTLYNGAGQKQGLVVTIPPAAGSTPTGQVFNSAGAGDFNGAVFMFATEDGTIASWKPANGTMATLAVPNSGAAVYKGLAIDSTSARIYAANFNSNTVDVFDSTFTKLTPGVQLPVGAFHDGTIPADFAPFGIQNVNGNIIVTYAKQDVQGNGHDDVAGAGNGFVDIYDANGTLLKRLVTNGPLNSPWGVALAPSNFGAFGNDLLVGNFGDGTINAFDPVSGAFLGQLTDASGNPIIIQGLWGLLFGNGGNGGTTDQLFFSAGIPGPTGDIEDHGLFGLLAIPEPSTMALLASGLALLGLRRRRA